MRTYTLEVRCDLETEEQYDVVKQSVIDAARQVKAMSMLLSGKRQPEVVVHSTDFFVGNEDIDINEDVNS